MQLDGNAATIVRDCQETLGIEVDVDKVGMPGNGFVHRVVDDFGKEMVQRLLVGPADIHARTHADRLQAFENPDGGRTVVVGTR